MHTNLYQEAVLEAQQLRKAAEDNATRAVIEAITPRLRKLIERQILSEEPVEDDDVLLGALGDIADGAGIEMDSGNPSGVSMPDADGKVTLDLDTLTVDNPDGGAAGPGETPVAESAKASDALMLSTAAARALMTLQEAKFPTTVTETQERISRIRRSLEFGNHLIESDLGRQPRSLSLLGRLCDKMLQETRILKEGTIGTERTESSSLSSEIGTLRKEIMEMATRKRLTEMDVMLKLSLPDDLDVDLSDLDVEVVDSGEGDEDVDMDFVDEEDGEEDMDFGDEEEEESDMAFESDDMDLNEEDIMLQLTGLPDDADFDLSGLDVSVVDDDLDGEEDVEMDMDLGDEEGEDDMDDMDVSSLDDDEVVEIDEGMLRRELARMRKIAEGSADDPKILDDFGGAKKDREAFVDSSESDLNKHDSVGTVKVEANQLRKLKNESRQNRALRKQVTELRSAVDKLSSQLKEMNLFNSKLLYVNRLMHTQDLSEGQIKSVVTSLDKAQTLREVRLLYKGFTDSLGGKKSKSLTESAHRSQAGGSSRSTGRASSSAQGNTQSARWAKLAGLSNES